MENARITWQLAVLFVVAAVLLLLMDRQMITGPEDLNQWPFALLSLMVMAALFGAVALLVLTRLKNLVRQATGLEQRLGEVSRELTAVRDDFEQRVERRTFEISVANASLNREIAERIQAETETRRVKRRMELILECAGDGIFGLDTEGKVTFVNRAAALMLGWEADDLVGLSHHSLIHHTRADGSDYPVGECPIHQAYRDGKVHFGADEVFWKHDGGNFPVEYVSTPILENQRLTGAVVVFRDLTLSRPLPSMEAGHEHA